jgi:hypothetical protein
LYVRPLDVPSFPQREGVCQGFSSCKFIGDDLQLCGNLLGEPQLFPLLVKFHHF